MSLDHHPRKRYSLVATGMLLWVALVLGLYYWVHKPITPAFVRAVLGAAVDIITAMIIVSIASVLGRNILERMIDTAFWSPWERVAASGLVGLSVLSLLLLAVGSIWLSAASVEVLLLICLASSVRAWGLWFHDLRRCMSGGLPSDRWGRFLASVTLFILVITLILAVLPPTKWDVLTYHLAGAEQYVEQGRFYAVAHNHFLGFPQLVDTLFAGQLALTGQLTGPAVLHWAVGVLLFMAVGGYTARHADALAGWMAVATLLTAKSLWLEMTFSYVDVMPVGLMVIALTVLEQWHTTRHSEAATSTSRNLSWRYLLLIGMLTGFGMGVKYSVLWFAVAFGLAIIWLGRRDGFRSWLTYGAIYGVAAFLVFAPWLLRNVLWYDNPVYPLVFSSAEMDTIRLDWYSQPESGLIYRSDNWQIPLLPLTATFLGVEGAGTYGTDIGPLFLILLPLLLVTWRDIPAAIRTVTRQALIIAGVVFVAWWFTATFESYISLQTRLVLYMFGPLAVVSGISFESLRHLPKKPFDVYFVMRALMGLALVFTVIDAARYLNNSDINTYFSGEPEYDERYLEQALGWHFETMQQVNQLPVESTVRFLWEPRYLYCDKERLTCHTDSLMDAWYYARRTVADGNPAAIASAWRLDGADYLLVYEFGRTYEQENSEFYTAADWVAWDTFVNAELVEIRRNGNADDDIQYILYRWSD